MRVLTVLSGLFAGALRLLPHISRLLARVLVRRNLQSEQQSSTVSEIQRRKLAGGAASQIWQLRVCGPAAQRGRGAGGAGAARRSAATAQTDRQRRESTSNK